MLLTHRMTFVPDFFMESFTDGDRVYRTQGNVSMGELLRSSLRLRTTPVSRLPSSMYLTSRQLATRFSVCQSWRGHQDRPRTSLFLPMCVCLPRDETWSRWKPTLNRIFNSHSTRNTIAPPLSAPIAAVFRVDKNGLNSRQQNLRSHTSRWTSMWSTQILSTMHTSYEKPSHGP